MSDTKEKAYRERILQWVDQVKPGTFKKLQKADKRYSKFVEIIKEVIEANPLCGLEFIGNYDGIKVVDLDFSETISLELKQTVWASLPNQRPKHYRY